MGYIKMFEDFVSGDRLNEFLKELDTFDINIGDYAIFGSGPLSVRGIIEPSDLDVILKEDIYPYGESPIVIGNIEFSYQWPGFEGRIDELIESADIINGYPFVKLEYVEEYKNNMHRDKDEQHLMDLEKYNNNLLDKAINYVKKYNKGYKNPYHNTEHMIYVYEKAMMLFNIYKEEYNLTGKDRLTIGLASLFHDFNHSGGELPDKDNIKMAIGELDKFIDDNYVDVDKDEIHDILLTTEFPYTYKEEDLNTLKKIMLDADVLSAVYDPISSTINLSEEWGMDKLKFLYRQKDYINNMKYKLDYSNMILKSRKEDILRLIDEEIKKNKKTW